MFGISLIKTSKLKHLYSEVSSLAIENVNLNKEVVKRDVAIADLSAELNGERGMSACLASEYNYMQKQCEHLKKIISVFQLDKRRPCKHKKNRCC